MKTPRTSLLFLLIAIAGCAAPPEAPPMVPSTALLVSEPIETSFTDIEALSDFELDPATLDVTPSNKKREKPSNKKSEKPNWTRSLYHATFSLTLSQSVVVMAMTQMPPGVTGWTGRAPSFTNVSRSFTLGPRFDDDKWFWNAVVHPLAGAEYYLLARNRGLAGWQALVYSAALSAFWEFGPEAMYERASIQDLIITPLAGAILGECRYQARKALIDPQTGRANTTWKRVAVVLLDPIEAITE